MTKTEFYQFSQHDSALVDMILLYFTKAFDKVRYKKLVIKVHAVKLEEKCLVWTLDFLYLQAQCFQLFDDSGNCTVSSCRHGFQ